MQERRGFEVVDSTKYWGKSYKELKNWQQAEILATNHLIKNLNREAVLQKHNNPGYDILVNGRFRVDVKWVDGKTRNPDELAITLRIKKKRLKGQEHSTDFFLVMFGQVRDGEHGIAGYLIPYDYFGDVNVKTISRYNVPKDWAKFELTDEHLRALGIYKMPRKLKAS